MSGRHFPELYPRHVMRGYFYIMGQAIRQLSTTELVDIWSGLIWPDFLPHEFACHHCGENYYWPDFFTKLQAARKIVSRPFHVLSGHRCSLHNARVGGAPLSQHLKLAVDISLDRHDVADLFAACQHAGFTGFGFYQTFLHVDLGRKRHWYGSNIARRKWQTFLD